MRVFVAVPISPEIRAKAFQLAKEAIALSDPHGSRLRAVGEQNLHLTIQFLGETTDEKAHALSIDLEGALRRLKPFSISLGGVGAFPRESALRVLWIGIHDLSGGLSRVADAVRSVCSAHGFQPEEREFRPHLTVARLKHGAHCKLAQDHREMLGRELGEEQVNSVKLIRSHLEKAGSRYEEIGSFGLRGSD